MKKSFKSTIGSWIKPLIRTWVYIVPSPSLIAGMKRRGGLNFIPRRSLSREHKFLKSLDLNNKTIYDIGGYVGLMTMFFSRAVGDNGKVITFEPNPENVCAIEDHLNLNNLTNVQVIQMGLGKEPGTLKFVVVDAAWGTADPYRQKKLMREKGAKVIEIQIDTLDNQITSRNLLPPDLVKIDVEGFELEVLQGMSRTIERYRPEMSIELHGTNEAEIIEFLLANRYKILQVEDGIEIDQKNIEKKHGHLYVHN